MAENFTADIEINFKKGSKKVVKIIPHYDSYKYMAKKLEDVLNNELHYEDGDCDLHFGTINRLAS